MSVLLSLLFASALAAQGVDEISTDEPLPRTTAPYLIPFPEALSPPGGSDFAPETVAPVDAPEPPPAPKDAKADKKKKGPDKRRGEDPSEPKESAYSLAMSTGPACRAVHLTSWIAGTGKSRRAFLDKLKGTVVNAVVIPLKETDGHVYIPGVAKASEVNSYRPAIPDPAALLKDLKAQNLRAIARIVVFKDNYLPKKHPEWAVRRPDGRLWLNQNGIAWVDPYQRPIWDYNLQLAVRAAELGFDEIQFDYLRFPSDGNTKLCRYSNPHHTSASAIENLREFLDLARKRLAHTKVPVSIAVFGMTTTAKDDMGIGQEISKFAPMVEFISPMMYPSHYARGEYGLSSPNREPYKIIFRGLRDAKARLKQHAPKLRPYLQDFSIYGVRYGPSQVRAQILAAHLQGVESWILWNPSNRYTWDTLTPKALGAAGMPVESLEGGTASVAAPGAGRADVLESTLPRP